MMRYVLTFLLFPIFGYSQKQAFLTDYKKICDMYFNQSNMEVHSTLNMYAGHTGKALISTSKAVVKIKNKEIHQEIEEIITIVNPNYMIQVDKNDQYIILDRTPKLYFNNLWNLSLDQSMQMIENATLIKNTQNEKSYSIEFNYGEIEKCIISFHPSSFQVTSLTLFYAIEDNYYEEEPERMDKARLEINFRFIPKVASIIYTIKDNPFCTFHNETLVAKHGYKKYELIDNRIKQ